MSGSDTAWALERLLTPSDLARFRRSGHFRYESGQHGDLWLSLELLFAEPGRLDQSAQLLADQVRHWTPDIIVAALVGGALVGQQVAAHLGTRFVYAERPASPGPEYDIPPALSMDLLGARVVVVDDVINAGAATLATAEAARTHGAEVVGAAALLIRSVGTREHFVRQRIPLVALGEIAFNSWPPEECPLCQMGLPLETPLD